MQPRPSFHFKKDWLLSLAALLSQDLSSLSSWAHSLSFFWGWSSHLLGFMSLFWFTLLFVGALHLADFGQPCHGSGLGYCPCTIRPWRALLSPLPLCHLLGNLHCYRCRQDGQKPLWSFVPASPKRYLALCFKINIKPFFFFKCIFTNHVSES